MDHLLANTDLFLEGATYGENLNTIVIYVMPALSSITKKKESAEGQQQIAILCRTSRGQDTWVQLSEIQPN